jgi:ABC-type hemin transport system substrate-binding protein
MTNGRFGHLKGQEQSMRGLLLTTRTFICISVLSIVSGMGTSASAVTPQRIISLSPATTEVLFALGAGDRIVGVTSFCDHPAEAKKKAKIGGMSNPSLESIVALRPDLVVLTTDGNPQEAEARLRSMKLRTYVWTARTLADLPGGIRGLAQALELGEQGQALASGIERSLNSYRVRTDASASHGRRTRVLYIVWPEPLLVAGPGTAIHDAIMLLGMENTAAAAGTSYPRYSIEAVIREAPDVLCIGKGSGMDMRTVSEGILKKLRNVPAVKNGRICYVSDSLYRLGPRVVAGIEELAACAK